MPETACLHIQARDSDPVRVVEIPGTSVRIGRASFCEVRLAEPDLAEEECRLRRKGGQWQLVPSRGSGFVWIDGRSVEETCALPFDVPFRVGEHWLTLRPNGSAPSWGSYQVPTPATAATVVDDIRAERPAGASEPADISRPAAADDTDHLSRWKDRHDERINRVRLGDEQRRWEERWRAAGERLRTNSPTGSPARTARPPDSQSYRSARPRPARFDDSTLYRPPTPPPQRVPFVPPPAPEVSAAPVVETPDQNPVFLEESGFFAPAVEHDAPAQAPDQKPAFLEESRLLAPATENVVPDQKPAFIEENGFLAPAAEEDLSGQTPHQKPASFKESGLLALAPATEEEPAAPTPDQEPALSEVNGLLAPADASVHEDSEDAPDLTADELPALKALPVPAADEPAAQPAVAESAPPEPEPAPVPRAEPRRRGEHAPFVTDTNPGGEGALPPRSAFSTTVHDAGVAPLRAAPPRAPRPAAPQPGAGRRPDGRKPAAPRGAEPREDTSRRRETVPPESTREWPTVQDILAGHRAHADRVSAPRPASRMTVSEPMPTEPAAPAHWSLPLWLGWVPSLALTLAVGTVGVALNWTWSVDARKAAAVTNLLAQGTAEVKALPPKITPPDPSWWRSTPTNLMQWALYLDRRSGPEPENAERALELLAAASSSSPAHPQVRFALARRPAAEGEAAPALESSLGLSRDVVALSWSAQQWLKAGKKQAALKTYRAALEIAARAEPSRMAPPSFDDDPQIKRYRIPGEETFAVVIREMADEPSWSYAEWSEALPPFAVAHLAAARLLRERGNLDSDKALEAITSTLSVPAPAGCPAALHLAAQAEALALKSQWQAADTRYRTAIGMIPLDSIKRTWWMNVADIALKLNDEPARQKALETAKGNDANDEVAHRAIEILKYAIVRAERPRPPR